MEIGGQDFGWQAYPGCCRIVEFWGQQAFLLDLRGLDTVTSDGNGRLKCFAGVKDYIPMNEPGLYRIFADTPMTPEDILQFIDHYGVLGGERQIRFTPRQYRSELQRGVVVDTGFVDAECDETVGSLLLHTLTEWSTAINEIQTALSIWEHCSEGDWSDVLTMLAKAYGRTSGDVYRSFVSKNNDCDDSAAIHELVYDAISSFDMTRKLVVTLSYDVPYKIYPHHGHAVNAEVSPVHLWLGSTTESQSGRQYSDSGSGAWEMIMACMQAVIFKEVCAEIIHQHGRLFSQIAPRSLYGVIWLQLARAVIDNRQLQSCRHCGRWFEYHPETARTNKRFCSDNCKFKAYRQRQKQARELHKEGLTIEGIAARLDSDVKTVNGWITKNK